MYFPNHSDLESHVLKMAESQDRKTLVPELLLGKESPVYWSTHFGFNLHKKSSTADATEAGSLAVRAASIVLTTQFLALSRTMTLLQPRTLPWASEWVL